MGLHQRPRLPFGRAGPPDLISAQPLILAIPEMPPSVAPGQMAQHHVFFRRWQGREGTQRALKGWGSQGFDRRCPGKASGS